MMRDSTLTTVALLAAYTQDNRRHYLDLFIPFIKYCCPKSVGTRFTWQDIQSKMRDEFGMADMPKKIIETVIRRQGKHECPIARKERDSFVVVCEHSNETFERERNNMQEEVDYATKRLQEYIAETIWKDKIKLNAKQLLLAFFNDYGLTTLSEAENISVIPPSDLDRYVVARFIQNAEQNDKPLFQSLCSITKGFLAYRAIYQIDDGDKRDSSSRLRGVYAFLDCALVIDYLGYDEPQSKSATTQLVEMLRKNGCNVCVFTHTIEEAQQLLMSYADSENKASFRLSGLKRMHFSNSLVRGEAFKIEKELRNHGIGVYDAMEKSILPYKEEYAQSVQEYLRSQDSFNRGIRSCEYDCASMRGIIAFRKGRSPQCIEDCRAILITKEKRLAYDVKKNVHAYEVALAKLDVDIAALLWLQNFTESEGFPKEWLLCCAAASTTMSDDLRKKACEYIKRWEDDGKYEPTTIAHMRSDNLDELFIVTKTGNDPDLFTESVMDAYVMERCKTTIDAQIEAAVQQVNAEKEQEIEKSREEGVLEESEKIRRSVARRIDDTARKRASKCRKIISTMVVGIEVMIFLCGAIDTIQSGFSGRTVMGIISIISLVMEGRNEIRSKKEKSESWLNCLEIWLHQYFYRKYEKRAKMFLEHDE